MATDCKYIPKNLHFNRLPIFIGDLWAFRSSIVTLINVLIFGNKNNIAGQQGIFSLFPNEIRVRIIWLFTYYFGTFAYNNNIVRIPDWAEINKSYIFIAINKNLI